MDTNDTVKPRGRAGGRKRTAPDGEVRRKRGLWLSDAEWRRITERAFAERLSVSEWVRRKLLGRRFR